MSLPKTWNQQGAYYVPLRINLLTRMIEREMNRELHHAFKLSVAEWRVLAMTCTEGPVSAADVSAGFEADPGQVSRAVASLLAAGLLERETVSGNRKKKRLSATPRGSEVFDVLHRRRQAYYKSIMRDLSAQEIETFDKALGIIARRVDEVRELASEDDPPG